MKKTILTVSVIALLSLSACGKKNDSNNTSSTSSGDKTTTSKVTKSSSAKDNTTQNSSEKTTINVVENLKKTFYGQKIPMEIPHSTDKKLSATHTNAHSQSFSISYFETDESLALNDVTLEKLQPFATFNSTLMSSEEEAIKAVEYQQPDGVSVNLNHGLTGYQQGAAGSSYVAWKEGNWSILVQTTNANNEDSLALANNIVELLEEIFLPAPTNVGQIKIHLGQKNELAFNQGNNVYKLTHNNYEGLIKMAASIAEAK